MSVRSNSPTPQRPRLEFLAAPALLGCLLLAWQGTVSLSGVSAFILPSPGAVLAALLHLLAAPAVWRHVGLTALETGVGFFGRHAAASSKQVVDGPPARAMTATRLAPRCAGPVPAPTGHRVWASYIVLPRCSPATVWCGFTL